MPYSNKERKAEYQRWYRKEFREKINEINRKSAARNKERKKIWYEKNKERQKEIKKEKYNKDKTIAKNHGLKKKYGITYEGFLQLGVKQNWKCPICGCVLDPNSRYTHVDHDHATGLIRGLLCNNCNCGLGYFRDNQISLKNAIEYLQKNGI
jgi:hypothetical protein